ncbi:hypothetical protein CDG77_18685 [Nostoc sp. 'Peltigera membranacea cyanobiont' 213]|uniref:hypothetical protein n=1 Tax=Nostoc sp. 'Peltigera membranacea cyanobiont' 213 TaxID=2014530 RepID=UPI000B950818|nr:hypothetical protein [Nostoc sp. 'Peltigera membranacea cyanobiont' 213]OYD89520.1 hypothetical protein CDG77_18685 [Nostoc sp. 'Peltigera membranacea cyanobiont' 213]
MREIGFIKWFGGYDRQRGRENDFGYIGREGRTDDIKVYREEVNCLESSLIEGTLVTFELVINLQTNKQFATNLNLFKEVGRIKTFGTNIGRTSKNNYWFIECQYQDNTLLHKSQIHFLESDLKEGTLIKFELRKYGDGYRAKNVHLLDFKKETDSDIIQRCLNHNDPRFCALGFWRYLNNNSIEEAISLAEEKFKRYSSWEKKRFLGEAPEAIVLYFETQTLKQVLPDEKQFKLLLQLLNNNLSIVINDNLKQEIFNIITKFQNVNLTLCDKIITKFYKLYLDHPEDRKQLRIQLHTKCLVELISDLENDLGQVTLLNELRDTLVHSKASELWIFIPNYILLKQEIWPITPRDKRVGILVSQITNQQDLNHQDKILEIAEVLEESVPEEIPTLISIFRDKHSIKCHDAILKFLPAVEQITILRARLNNNVSENANIISQIAKILAATSSDNLQFLISKLPDSVKIWDEILEFLPPEDKFLILLSKLKEEYQLENQDIIQKIGNVINAASNEERIILIDRLPDGVKYKEPILQSFHFLLPEDQIRLVWSFIADGSLFIWHYLSREAKILCVYRLAKENTNISLFITEFKRIHNTNPENDNLIRCVLKILWAKEHPNRSNEVFQEVHELLINYVIQYAKNSTEPINLDPLLPYCKPTEVKVKYCEGKLWEREEIQTTGEAKIVISAYCPRARNNCNLFEPNRSSNSNFGLYGARLSAECSQDWKNWSLLELFKAVDIVPSMPDLRKPEDYLPKLSGWINRINEIRSRLKCSVCEDIMPHNIEYSQFSTRFRVTVFSCKHGEDHDHNIYLNECWGCSEIIDSRESRYQSPEKNYYICIHCGSGTQHSNTYTQGDICPKCGTIGMKVSKRYRNCHSCNHSIKLPEERKITGSECPQCRTQGMMLTVNQKNKQVRVCRFDSCRYSISAT